MHASYICKHQNSTSAVLFPEDNIVGLFKWLSMSKWVVFLSYINFGGDFFPCIDIAKVLNILEVQKSNNNNCL